MSSKEDSFTRRGRVIGLIVFLLLVAAVTGAAACGESTPATSAPATSAPTTTAVKVTTTEATAGGVTTTQPAEGQATDTTVGGGSSVRTLGENDSGNEIILRVGDRVRIELEPFVNDRVKSVKWDYVPIVVREVDLGAEIVSDVVIECWLELEAVIAGPVTVRAEYEYPFGTKQTTWVGYFIVRE